MVREAGGDHYRPEDKGIMGTEENRALLQKWLLQYYGSSAFNTSVQSSHSEEQSYFRSLELIRRL